MPPAVSESSEEESDGGVIEFSKSVPKKEEFEEAVDEGDEDEDDLDDEEGIYVVEKILKHKFQGKELHLEVKWKGYNNPADNTWEPESNVTEGAEEILAQYFDSIGGRPEPPGKGGKKKRPISSNGTPESSQSKKKFKRNSNLKQEVGFSTPEIDTPVDFSQPDWVPDSKEWEKEVHNIETIEREGKSGTLFVYLHWKNGMRSKVDIAQCYEKCPQAMLQFYESHLVFKTM